MNEETPQRTAPLLPGIEQQPGGEWEAQMLQAGRSERSDRAQRERSQAQQRHAKTRRGMALASRRQNRRP